MDISLDKTENNEALIKIKVNEEDYQPGVDQKIKDYSKKANLKGFRPGKVPPGLIKKMYGQSFVVEEINRILSENLSKYLQESDLQFLGEPLPVREEISQLDWDNQKDFEFKYDVGYADEFDLKIDKKVKIDYFKIKVDKKVMDDTIDRLKRQFGEESSTEVVAADDMITGKLVSEAAEIDRDDLTIDLKECQKAGNSKLIGAKVGDTVQVDSKKFFTDAEYLKRIAGMTEDQLKAAKNKFDFTIASIKHVVPSELNQELFDKTFGPEAVKTEEEFREKVKETVSKNYDRESDQLFEYKIKDYLREKAKIALPDNFLKRWLVETNEKMTEELVEHEYEMYNRELQWSLISGQVAKSQDIKAEHEEVFEEAKNQILQQFGGPAIAAQLGDQLDQFANNYLQGEEGDNYRKVYNQVLTQKIMDYIKGEISKKEKEVSIDEFQKQVSKL